MLYVAGTNIYGQWNSNHTKLSYFQPADFKYSRSMHNESHNEDDNTKTVVIGITWSYTLWRSERNFYLTGCWLGENYKKVKVELPKNLETALAKLLIVGDDYKLVLFSQLNCDFWVVKFEIPFIWNWCWRTLVFQDERDQEPKRVKLECFVTKAIASNRAIFCLTSNGCVFDLPNQVNTARCNGLIIDIACGYEHALLLTDTGEVYSWGNGRRCQLGHGDLDNIDEPTLIEALAGIKITKIKAGGWHSLALSEIGDLYAWGWNDAGQLGIKKYQDITISDSAGLKSLPLPMLVDIYKEEDVLHLNIRDIACGSRHSAIILSDNTLWTSGLNSYGQLGFCSISNPNLDYFRFSFQSTTESSLMCGPWSTMVIPT